MFPAGVKVVDPPLLQDSELIRVSSEDQMGECMHRVQECPEADLLLGVAHDKCQGSLASPG